ncbi:hypothetical protein P4S72_24095 [Vibrio sp. PP-XX7]
MKEGLKSSTDLRMKNSNNWTMLQIKLSTRLKQAVQTIPDSGNKALRVSGKKPKLAEPDSGPVSIVYIRSQRRVHKKPTHKVSVSFIVNLPIRLKHREAPSISLIFKLNIKEIEFTQ